MIYRSREMECLEAISSSSSKKKKKSRFSEEQIRSLEVMFESDTKLEAKKKAEVATELGLQPRQVAIWFQNKRARWKSKHLESEFNTLLNNYNNLTSQYECLKKHNLSLLAQIEELQKVKYKGSGSDEESSADYIIHGYSCSCKNAATDDDSHDHDQVVKINNNISGVSSDDDADHNDDGRRKAEFLQGLMDDDGRELLKMVEPHHHVSVDQDWGNLNDITSSLPWWDFWS